MNVAESFRGRTFVVADPDARIRHGDDLMALVQSDGGSFQTIPKGTEVRIVEVKIAETGSRSSIVFGRASLADGTQVFGWTSTRNLEGKFINMTIGVIRPEPGASRFGPNAAWSAGEFLGQLELAAIVDSKLEIERLALKTIEPYAALVAAAAKDEVLVTLNSGFRSYPEQKLLHDGFSRGLPGLQHGSEAGLLQAPERHRLRHFSARWRWQPDLRVAEAQCHRLWVRTHCEQGALALGVRPAQGPIGTGKWHVQDFECHSVTGPQPRLIAQASKFPMPNRVLLTEMNLH